MNTRVSCVLLSSLPEGTKAGERNQKCWREGPAKLSIFQYSVRRRQPNDTTPSLVDQTRVQATVLSGVLAVMVLRMVSGSRSSSSSRSSNSSSSISSSGSHSRTTTSTRPRTRTRTRTRTVVGSRSSSGGSSSSIHSFMIAAPKSDAIRGQAYNARQLRVAWPLPLLWTTKD